MIIELHMLQNFAPSCLNRDDTNSPKECQFGGYRRARISSQCIKSAIRRNPDFDRIVESKGGIRTKRLIPKLVMRMKGRQDDKLSALIAKVFEEGGISSKEGRTDIILFIDKAAVDEIANLFKQNLDILEKGDKDSKKKVIDILAKILVEKVKVPDIALFGRMLAIEPSKPLGDKQLNVDAACQVAHAISTHKVGVEIDFYTAVDDLQPKEETGAGMMGDIEFNSACYYRYANINLEQLKDNLGGDDGLAQKTVEAFIRAAASAVPSGKQTSFAAQNPPDFIMAVVRHSGSWSLANAFAKPILVKEDCDLMADSIGALVDYWGKLNQAYGTDSVTAKLAMTLRDVNLGGLQQVDSFEDLVRQVKQAIANGG